VIVNGVTLWRASWCGDFPNQRGVSVVVIDPLTCAIEGDSQSFDTYASVTAARGLRYHLQQVDEGKVIIAATGDEPTRNLRNALPALRQLGVDVGDVGYRGSFVFVAQKGYPEKTIQDKVVDEDESVTAPANLDVTTRGMHSRDGNG